MKNAIIVIIIGIILLSLIIFIYLNKNNEENIYLNKMEIKSVFVNNGYIPIKYTGKGEDINPKIDILNIPDNAESLVLIVDDPDAPVGTWVHWVVWNIPITNNIKENSNPGVQGVNSWGRNDYGGPNPPSGTHRYFFKLYALDNELDLPETSLKKDVEKAMKGHILDKAELVGLYSKK